MFWGITPALDLIELYKNEFDSTPEIINILLIGGADSRHIIKTLAKRYTHGKIEINFYIIEACCETVAKQLLLLNIALQPQAAVGLSQKTKIFMELYGNTLVRPTTAKYLTSTAIQLVKMITDYNYLKLMMSCVELEIKYKERDYLENLIKFWSSKDDFDICRSWDKRLRDALGIRYDSRKGVFDWDLHMRLHTIGGKSVCVQEYQTFRMNGIAFNWMESEVSKPNRSMVCVVEPNGANFIHYGYLGDMQTGPFISFGIKCEDEQYLKSTHGDNVYRATDITERNLSQYFHEIEFNEQYEHKCTSDIKMGSVTMKLPEKRVMDLKASDGVKNKISKCIDLDAVSIKFLSIGAVELMKYKSEYKKLFDVIYFGNSYLKFIKKEFLENVCSDQSMILVENKRFALCLRDDDLKKHHEEVKNLMKEMKVEERFFDPIKSNYNKFIFNNHGTNN